MGKHIRTARSRPASRRAHSEESTGWREQLATVARAALGTGAVVVLAVLAILAGALLAVHGPGSGGAAQSPSRQVTLGPPPKAKAPAAQPKHKTDNRTPKARPGAAKTARPKTVVLVPGDTLYGLANKRHTTVKTLQRLNKLGSSTLI
ncbi:LysM peptidoglycan-binding domain-containing protein, partial [Streptomyces sp. MCAF7]